MQAAAQGTASPPAPAAAEVCSAWAVCDNKHGEGGKELQQRQVEVKERGHGPRRRNTCCLAALLCRVLSLPPSFPHLFQLQTCPDSECGAFETLGKPILREHHVILH
eukprot:scaffold316534_cov22-Tisochrysis_lutea.AAC.1